MWIDRLHLAQHYCELFVREVITAHETDQQPFHERTAASHNPPKWRALGGLKCQAQCECESLNAAFPSGLLIIRCNLMVTGLHCEAHKNIHVYFKLSWFSEAGFSKLQWTGKINANSGKRVARLDTDWWQIGH